MSKYNVTVEVKATMLKSFSVEADHQDEAEDLAWIAANKDIELGETDGWDMTTDSEVIRATVKDQRARRCPEDKYDI